MEAGILLQACMEVTAITPLQYVAGMRLPAAYEAVTALMEQPVRLEEHLAPLLEAHLRQAGRDTRRFLAVAAARSLPLSLSLIAGRVEDALERKFHLDLGLATAAERDRAARDNESPEPLFAVGDQLYAGTVKRWLRRRYAVWFRNMARDARRMRAAAAWYQQDGGARFRALDQALAPREDDLFGLLGMAVSSRGVLADMEARLAFDNRRARKPLKRAVRLFHDLGQEERLRRFLRGEAVAISHPGSPFVFVARLDRPGRLLEDTLRFGPSIPYDLRLYTRDGVYLGQLCAVVRQTPVLDQLLALILFVESGEEASFLAEANWHENGDVAAMRRELLPRFPRVAEFIAGEGDVAPGGGAESYPVADVAAGLDEKELKARREPLWRDVQPAMYNWVRQCFSRHFFMGDEIAGVPPPGGEGKGEKETAGLEVSSPA